VVALCERLTAALHPPTRHGDCTPSTSHIVPLSLRNSADAASARGVGIDVLSSISRLELQLRDEHVPSLMLSHEACARLFHQKLVHQQNPSDRIIHMTTAVQTLLENIRRRKTRVKCLADISKMLQRCRAQSIYFVQLRSYTTRTYTANTGATRDVDTFPITTMITVLALTQLVIDNVLYGADTFPTTPDESELVAVFWMFARDFHARPDILSRMICYNT